MYIRYKKTKQGETDMTLLLLDKLEQTNQKDDLMKEIYEKVKSWGVEVQRVSRPRYNLGQILHYVEVMYAKGRRIEIIGNEKPTEELFEDIKKYTIEIREGNVINMNERKYVEKDGNILQTTDYPEYEENVFHIYVEEVEDGYKITQVDEYY